MTKGQIIIADNHPLFRSGVRQTIEDSGQFDIVCEVGDGDSCIEQVEKLRPDILILDLNLPEKSGFQIVQHLMTSGVLCRIIILSMHSSADFVSHAKKLGCAGFVAKEDAGLELINILANSSGSFIASSSAGLGEKVPDLPSDTAASPPLNLDELTPTEINVLREIANSKTSKEIAENMGISERTIHTHRQNINKKLNLKGANSLLRT
ncbi:MAG: response regulator transcription factor [Pseudomonadota bacterium]